jgi:LmbE family N-acetylglucosaminyl deacetylase
MNRTIAVIAPHPDDEVLGAGGTIARRSAEGDRVHIVTVTRGCRPLFAEEAVIQCRREAEEAHGRLGVRASHWLDLPAAELDTLPVREVNDRLGTIISEIDPDELFIPFLGDIHRDHQIIFEAAVVAVRPHRRQSPASVYAYETLSETNWNGPYVTPAFHPTHFVDISAHLDVKLDALRCFLSQMRDFPHERSLVAVRALAMLRGATVAVPAAEAFVTVRTVEHAWPTR